MTLKEKRVSVHDALAERAPRLPPPNSQGVMSSDRKDAMKPEHESKPVLERLDLWLLRSRPSWWAALAIGTVVMVIGAVIPELLGVYLYPSEDRTDGTNSLRTGLLGVIAFGSVAAWVVQYRQTVLTRILEEYNDRLRQLSQSEWDQVAGIRDLEDLAKRDDELRTKTVQILAVYVREKVPRSIALSEIPTARVDKGMEKGKRRPEPGVQEALRVIGSHLSEWAPQPENTKNDAEEASEDDRPDESVGGKSWASNAAVGQQDTYLSLADTAIDGAVLTGARLRGLNLRRTLMRDVKLERADLTGARLRDAVLTDADLWNAILANTSLVKAKLIRADLRGADLRGADLRGADLTEANVSGAHLWSAVGLNLQSKWIGKPHCEPGGPECRESWKKGQS
jgi:hypothetical protein